MTPITKRYVCTKTKQEVDAVLLKPETPRLRFWRCPVCGEPFQEVKPKEGGE